MNINKIISIVLLMICIISISCFAGTKSVPKLSKVQKEKINYVLMQENSKLVILNKNFNMLQQSLHNELSKPACNMDLINSLRLEQSSIAEDIAKVKFDAECAIRSILSSKQYQKYYKKLLKKRNK